ncbi:MAG TPA: hypothetical protein VIU33_04270 [Nitrospiria bacterium]
MDQKLASVERLVGLTMVIMGFFNILISWTNYELDIMPVLLFFFGAGLFAHSSIETWHKWVVIAVLVVAVFVFWANPTPMVRYWYKMGLFYGTILAVIYFMLSHKIKPSHDDGSS